MPSDQADHAARDPFRVNAPVVNINDMRLRIVIDDVQTGALTLYVEAPAAGDDVAVQIDDEPAQAYWRPTRLDGWLRLGLRLRDVTAWQPAEPRLHRVTVTYAGVEACMQFPLRELNTDAGQLVLNDAVIRPWGRAVHMPGDAGQLMLFSADAQPPNAPTQLTIADLCPLAGRSPERQWAAIEPLLNDALIAAWLVRADQQATPAVAAIRDDLATRFTFVQIDARSADDDARQLEAAALADGLAFRFLLNLAEPAELAASAQLADVRQFVAWLRRRWPAKPVLGIAELAAGVECPVDGSARSAETIISGGHLAALVFTTPAAEQA